MALTKGRVFSVNYMGEDKLVLVRNYEVYKVDALDPLNVRFWFKVPVNALRRALNFSGTLSRLLREGIHHIGFFGTDLCCVFIKKRIVTFDHNTGSVVDQTSIRFSRPLEISMCGSKMIFGEYTSNPHPSEVPIWSYCLRTFSLRRVTAIKDVRHIHAVAYDRFSDKYWITTGDSNAESKILIADSSFDAISVFREGGQMNRIVQPIFTSHYIYYATDAPDDQNSIFRYERLTGDLVSIAEVSGPIYYGLSSPAGVFFSTVVERTDASQSPAVEVYQVSSEDRVTKIFSINRSLLPLKWFQYAQVRLAWFSGDEADYLLLSHLSTKLHGSVTVLKFGHSIPENPESN